MSIMSEAAKELPTSDFRQSNPRYHRALVIYAQEDLKIMEEAIQRFLDVSRVNMRVCAGLIQEQKALLLRSSAAYQEALWRIHAEAELQEQPVDHKGRKPEEIPAV